MANGGLLAGIMNPAQVDVLGSMDKGRERQANQMAGNMLGDSLGGQIGKLARLSPEKAMAYAKATNTPTDDMGRIQNLMGTQIMVAKLWDAGDKDNAISTMQKQIQLTEERTGQEATNLRLAFADMQAGGGEVFNNFLIGGRSLDPTNKQPNAKDQSIIDLNKAKTDDLIASGSPKSSSTTKRNTSVIGNKIIDSDTGDVVYDGGDDGITIPPSLVRDLPADMAARVADSYSSAGGGKDGIQAANVEKALVQEDMRRDAAYESLSVQYPNASEDEVRQLRTAIDTAPTVEKGMAIAKTVRENQRAAQKASVMTDRALHLVNTILVNSELEDVIGSSEGKFGGTEQPTGAIPLIGGFISDDEATAIADIEEVTNILTVPAMEIMTGILSESDLKLLKTISGGAFNRTRGIDRFKKDVGQIQTVLKRASLIGKMNPRDREAAIWATNAVNMKNPDAIKIRQKLGLD